MPAGEMDTEIAIKERPGTELGITTENEKEIGTEIGTEIGIETGLIVERRRRTEKEKETEAEIGIEKEIVAETIDKEEGTENVRMTRAETDEQWTEIRSVMSINPDTEIRIDENEFVLLLSPRFESSILRLTLNHQMPQHTFNKLHNT